MFLKSDHTGLGSYNIDMISKNKPEKKYDLFCELVKQNGFSLYLKKTRSLARTKKVVLLHSAASNCISITFAHFFAPKIFLLRTICLK